MNTQNVITKLNINTVTDLHSVMLDICLAYYMGGDYQSILAKAKHGCIGFKRKSYDMIEKYGADGIERLAKVLGDI